MDDLGIANTVAGIEINRLDKHCYSLSQSQFASSIISRFNMTDAKPALTLLSPGLKLDQSTNNDLKEAEGDKMPYRNAVGSLMYLAQCTRPVSQDIS